MTREPGDGQVGRPTAFRDGLNDARRQIGERGQEPDMALGEVFPSGDSAKVEGGVLDDRIDLSHARAMAVSSETRLASSIALCRVGECATPLRSGSIGTKGSEIVDGDNVPPASESSFSCSVISTPSRYTIALSRRF